MPNHPRCGDAESISDIITADEIAGGIRISSAAGPATEVGRQNPAANSNLTAGADAPIAAHRVVADGDGIIGSIHDRVDAIRIKIAQVGNLE